MKNKKFGELLVHYRKDQKKVSQEELAHRISISKSYITKLENGQKPPAKDVAQAIAKALQLNEADTTLLMSAAAKDRLRRDDYKEYYQDLLQVDPLIAKECCYVPLFEYPQTKILPPYDKYKPIKHYQLSKDFIAADCYAIVYHEEYSSNEIEYRKGDVLIIDPYFKHLNLGDYVLVKILGDVTVKSYQLLQEDKRAYVHFLPYPVAGTATIFDPMADKDKFEIFGKVVNAIKFY